jgi:16S rRNA (guanine527-N7)-methyltransferase
VKLHLQSIVEALSEKQLGQLRQYEALLVSQAVPLGLVAVTDRDRMWERHVLDSIRAVACLESERLHIADLGSGAGLPGIPVAIARPDCAVVLVEARRRRGAFLELAVEELRLANARVVVDRMELLRQTFDTCLARGLGDPRVSWGLAAALLTSGGVLVYFGGRSFRLEHCPSVEEGVGAEICLQGAFQWQGPLVMMKRVRLP